MIFKQVIDDLSKTYTYLIACEHSKQAILIDPVMNQLERDIFLLKEYGLKLIYTFDTHIHADHLTSALLLKNRLGSKIAMPAIDKVQATDLPLYDNKPIKVGSIIVNPLHTPGHTSGHFAYQLNDRVFTGDALLIEGCGRTDFQQGSSETLFNSVHEKILSLSAETLIYPGHDYKGRRVSSVGQELDTNPRLGKSISKEEFVKIMSNLNLPYPKFIDYAVPHNLLGGVCPENLPKELENYCYRQG